MFKVVESLKGHDKGWLYVIVGEAENKVLLANGKQHPLEKPKGKNKKHIKDLGVTLEEINTNRSLRKKLNTVNR